MPSRGTPRRSEKSPSFDSGHSAPLEAFTAGRPSSPTFPWMFYFDSYAIRWASGGSLWRGMHLKVADSTSLYDLWTSDALHISFFLSEWLYEWLVWARRA
jgi:hypothetical protein